MPSPAAAPTAVDSQAPTAPGSLATGKITMTAIPLSWKASTDNVGVVRYAVSLNGTQILPPSPTATSYTFAGLTCGTSYTLGVQAFDASGNASPIANKTASTQACPAPPAPAPAPAPSGGSCPSNPLVGVQRPGQLTVLDGGNPCRTMTGTVADRDAIDLYRFTSLLNRSLDEAGRLRIVEMMWEIVYADRRVTELEDNLIWRAADLLGISSRERIELRQRVTSRESGEG